MPLLPRFALAQDASALQLTVRLPFVRVSDAELVVDGAELAFFCRPYLLRLTLPGALVDDERVRSTYDADDEHGTLTISVPKAVPGEVFPDLDLVTRLLQRPAAPLPPPRAAGVGAAGAAAADDDDAVVDLTHLVAARAGDEDGAAGVGVGADAAARLLGTLSLGGAGAAPAAAARRPLVEVMRSDKADPAAARASSGPPAAGPQRAAAHDASTDGDDGPDAAATAAAAAANAGSAEVRYGFNRAYSRVFAGGLREELAGVVELPDPDGTPALARRALREADEDARFDPVRYAGDNSDDVGRSDGGGDPVLVEALSMTPWWRRWRRRAGADGERVLGAHAATDSGGEDMRHAAVSTDDGGEGGDGGSAWAWSADEVEDMRQLPRREYLLDGHLVGGAAQAAPSSLGGAPTTSPPPAALAAAPLAGHEDMARIVIALVPLLAAYAYDHLTTGGDATCESPWTVATLAPALSWLDDEVGAPSLDELAAAMAREAVGGPAGGGDGNGDGSGDGSGAAWGAAPSSSSASPPSAAVTTLAGAVRAAAAAFQRRVLTFPYLRRWELGVAALAGAAELLAGGRRPVLRALLAVRRLLRADEQRYLLCTLVLDDYCVWAQAVPDAWLAGAAAALHHDGGAPSAAPAAAAAGGGGGCARLLTKSDAEFAGWQLELIDREGPEAVVVAAAAAAAAELGDSDDDREPPA